MYIDPQHCVIRKNTPFSVSIRLGGVPLASVDTETWTIQIDILDPVGMLTPVPFRQGKDIIFDKPAVGILLRRTYEAQGEDRAKSHVALCPQSVIDWLRENDDDLKGLIQAWLVNQGATPAQGLRVACAARDALHGQVERPDHFGVLDWAPSLNLPFGFVMSGPWIDEPEMTEPVSTLVKDNADE